jgi:hypothetical protein
MRPFVQRTVGTRSTGSQLLLAKLGTQWNASLPGPRAQGKRARKKRAGSRKVGRLTPARQGRRALPTIFGARKFAGSAGDARRFTKHTTKESK